MNIVASTYKKLGAPEARSMVTSLGLHVFILALVMLVPAQVLLRSAPPNKELDIVFYRPPEVPVPVKTAAAVPLPGGVLPEAHAAGTPAPAVKPRLNAPPGPDGPGNPELPKGPDVGYTKEERPPEPETK